MYKGDKLIHDINICHHEYKAKEWMEKYKDKLSEWLTENNLYFKNSIKEINNNNILKLYHSRARGSDEQLQQIFEFRGLLFDEEGFPIKSFIKNSLLQGLDENEYFNSCHANRRTLIDKKVVVAYAGEFTRELVEAVGEISIIKDDCFIDNHDILKCKIIDGICQKCYGEQPLTKIYYDIGLPVGVIAAQFIGERGTQLSMRTVHSAGTTQSIDIEGVKIIFNKKYKSYQEFHKSIMKIKEYQLIDEKHLKTIYRALNGSTLRKSIKKQKGSFLSSASYRNVGINIVKSIVSNDYQEIKNYFKDLVIFFI